MDQESGINLPGVYAICHKRINRLYIGSAQNAIVERIAKHMQELEGGRHASDDLQAEYIHAGAEAFFVAILYNGTDLRLIRRKEYFWLVAAVIHGIKPYNNQRVDPNRAAALERAFSQAQIQDVLEASVYERCLSILATPGWENGFVG